MFLHLYQIFSSLQGHLHFFVHFFFTFMEHFFIGHPISRVFCKCGVCKCVSVCNMGVLVDARDCGCLHTLMVVCLQF